MPKTLIFMVKILRKIINTKSISEKKIYFNSCISYITVFSGQGENFGKLNMVFSCSCFLLDNYSSVILLTKLKYLFLKPYI